jgi:hypothetical protein
MLVSPTVFPCHPLLWTASSSCQIAYLTGVCNQELSMSGRYAWLWFNDGLGEIMLKCHQHSAHEFRNALFLGLSI